MEILLISVVPYHLAITARFIIATKITVKWADITRVQTHFTTPEENESTLMRNEWLKEKVLILVCFPNASASLLHRNNHSYFLFLIDSHLRNDPLCIATSYGILTLIWYSVMIKMIIFYENIWNIFLKRHFKKVIPEKYIALEEKIVSFATSAEDQVHPLRHLKVWVGLYTTFLKNSKLCSSRNNWSERGKKMWENELMGSWVESIIKLRFLLQICRLMGPDFPSLFFIVNKE